MSQDFLRQEITKYGEMAEATYDLLLGKDPESPTFGSSRLGVDNILPSGNCTLHFRHPAQQYRVSHNSFLHSVMCHWMLAGSGAWVL